MFMVEDKSRAFTIGKPTVQLSNVLLYAYFLHLQSWKVGRHDKLILNLLILKLILKPNCLSKYLKVLNSKEQERLIVNVSSRTSMVKNKQDKSGTSIYTKD
jgi:hypothetical protein